MRLMLPRDEDFQTVTCIILKIRDIPFSDRTENQNNFKVNPCFYDLNNW